MCVEITCSGALPAENSTTATLHINEKTGKIIIKKDLLPNKSYDVTGYASDGYNRNPIILNIKS